MENATWRRSNADRRSNRSCSRWRISSSTARPPIRFWHDLKGCFPGADFRARRIWPASPTTRLRACGFSFAKIKAIRDIAEKTLAGLVPTSRQIAKLSDDEIIARLTEVRGVGRWTVEMLLIFQLGRPDVLPAADFGVRTGFRHAYRRRDLPSVKELLAYGERWRPHRTTASWYLWCLADAARKKK